MMATVEHGECQPIHALVYGVGQQRDWLPLIAIRMGGVPVT